MRVHCECQPVANYPAPSGAHGLAWSYLLDTVFAEAYHAGVRELRVVLPSAALEPEVWQRAQLSGAAHESATNADTPAETPAETLVETATESRALAWLCPGAVPENAFPEQLSYLYTLHHGYLAPAWLRRAEFSSPRALAERWVSAPPWYVLTWRVPLWGLLMRLSNQWQQPHWADWAMFTMRHQFMSRAAVPAFYTLRAWRAR